jgi:hypothetical protein
MMYEKQHKILEIREDEEGMLWFLVEAYYRNSTTGLYEDWWLHISDEYSNEHWSGDGPTAVKRYELHEVRSEN